MNDSEPGEINRASHDLESDGLSGVDIRIENNNLVIDGLPSPFSGGKGTRNEPLKTMANMDLGVTLRNTRYIAETIEGHGLKRTLFFTFNDRLIGVNSASRVQLIKDKNLSSEVWKKEAAWFETFLREMSEDENDPDQWTLSIGGEE
jgi:hypothetical protein